MDRICSFNEILIISRGVIFLLSILAKNCYEVNIVNQFMAAANIIILLLFTYVSLIRKNKRFKRNSMCLKN